jgi:hypothetical protein
VLAQGEQAARTDVVLSPGAQLSMASVNKLATCWAWRSLGSLSAVVGAELGRALGAVRVAVGVLEGALAAEARAVFVVVRATLGPPEGRTGANVVGGNVAVGAGRAPAFGARGSLWLVGLWLVGRPQNSSLATKVTAVADMTATTARAAFFSPGPLTITAPNH